MDQNNQPLSTMNETAGAPMTPHMTEHTKTKPMIIILAVVLILVLGGLYWFASRTEAPTIPTEENTSTTAQQEVQAVTNMSDDVTAIEADINASIQGLDEQNF